MKANVTSRTAQYMALFRALETTRSPRKRLFADPFASRFLDNGLKWAVRLCSIPGWRAFVERIVRKKIPGALSSGIARTKYIDELLLQSVDTGAQQVFILGAGFDTRGLRLPALKHLKVVEIDHPNTSAYKQAALRVHHMPANIFYYQIDFNKQSLDQLAAQHHFDFSVPTAIIWEGVTNYLDKHAIDNTFSFLQRFAPGSTVIFTYVHQEVLRNPAAFLGGPRLLEDVAALEERWTFGFEPEELAAYLGQYHFALQQDQGAAQYRQRYLPERSEKGYEFYRVACALRLPNEDE
ncbi:SAM-dependent methyltransferase [Chitinophaga polysaccharea]|uniref:class I SAM-dependent methyltransferase n=1 Tax=Chitinophaga TaxID=79328 RepID=UPI0014557177|nr:MULTISPECIES: SAM-dependent methyltransferase [Chitinophaga]NLR57931.1 SAM-dependent methyltransferase [Chitinophaga polysaccharea]NLU93524.1 SAM-dependent methyltransferase [Chitinophaga sp. Ak27]